MRKGTLFDGSFITVLREKKDMTLQELADAAGISKSHLWEIEKNRTEPGFTLAYKISKEVGCDMNLFVRAS